MPFYSSNISCGVTQYAGILNYPPAPVGPADLPTRPSTPTTVPPTGLSAPHRYLWTLISAAFPSCAMIVFSDADLYGNGIGLAKDIRDAFPTSTLLESPPTVNPNSRNVIRTWIWVPDWQDVAVYCTQYGALSAASRAALSAATQASVRPRTNPPATTTPTPTGG